MAGKTRRKREHGTVTGKQRGDAGREKAEAGEGKKSRNGGRGRKWERKQGRSGLDDSQILSYGLPQEMAGRVGTLQDGKSVRPTASRCNMGFGLRLLPKTKWKRQVGPSRCNLCSVLSKLKRTNVLSASNPVNCCFVATICNSHASGRRRKKKGLANYL